MSKRQIDKQGEVPELEEEFFKKARRGKEILPDLVELQQRGRGRPRAETTKRQVTLRLDPEVIDYFKRGGQGWQTRLNDALREVVKSSSE